MAFLPIYKGRGDSLEEVAQALVDDDLVEGIKRKLRRSKTRLRFSGKYPAARIGRRADTRKTKHLHYIVWEMVHGRVRRGQMIDHVNQNLLDNRLENLAAADASERQANSPKHRDNSTGFKGVSKNKKGRFVARVGKDGKLRHLGVYDTTFAAAHAVNHGFATLYPKVPIPNRLASDDLTAEQRRDIEANVERLLDENRR